MTAPSTSRLSVRPIPVSTSTIFDGVVTRQWKFQLGESSLSETAWHIVGIRHSTLSGFRYALLNGKEIYDSDGTVNMYTLRGLTYGRDSLILNIGGSEVILSISKPKNRTLYEYTCTIDGQAIPEMNSRDEDSIICSKSYDIVIDHAEVQLVKEEPVVFFVIHVKDGSDEKILRRRFKEFYDLNFDLSSVLKGVNTTTLPYFPPRSWKRVRDHFDHTFIENRRKQLELYVRYLALIPRVTSDPSFLLFFDLYNVPNVTYNIVFNEKHGGIFGHPAKKPWYTKLSEMFSTDSQNTTKINNKNSNNQNTSDGVIDTNTISTNIDDTNTTSTNTDESQSNSVTSKELEDSKPIHFVESKDL